MKKKSSANSKKPKIKTLDLFVARQKASIKYTAKILASMNGAIEAINEMSGIAGIEKQGGYLTWDDVSLVYEGDEGMIILVGLIAFAVGSEIPTESGSIVKVTKDTQQYFNRLVHVSFPLKIAQQTKKQVVAYFAKKKEDREAQAAVDTLDAGVTKETEFDLSVLTEEQRRAYETMGTKLGKA